MSRVVGVRFLSTPAMVLPSKLAPAPSQPLRIVSKRAAAARRRDALPGGPTNAHSNKTTKEPASEWPKPMQYAFGVACAVGVPCLMAEATVQYGPLREYVVEHHPQAAHWLRVYFGQTLPLSYYDALQFQKQQLMQQQNERDELNTNELIEPVHVLPGEHEGSVERDNEIKRLLSTPVQVMVHPLHNNNTETSNTNEMVVTMDAKLGAWNSQTQLSKAAGIMDTNSSSTSGGDGDGLLLALDFVDEETHGNNDNTQDSADNQFGGDAAFILPDMVDDSTNHVNWVEDLSRWTYAFSLWTTNFPSQQSQSSAEQKKGTIGAMTAEDVRRSKLEWEIATLQTNLNDPSCMKDRDEMTDELKQAKRELFSLKWKRRLG
eukprot:CAMPEP_0198283544 /NCGR_PEP_ID=MMETSP1449-20131203/3111_1 /TAXON_ID=420275 /ORGANISM="Attheya septentrionalis, Strain CCMP2084" /LENGTH=374 /DNA_ID=CAMNT_0043980189 /DNA_START=255 /DNA_END=1376 /DNA_ORIENTATION=-